MFAENQKGVSLIITFFIMIIILAVVLSVSVLLYSEVKIIRNIGNSLSSFYAANSGVEKVLYYDKQVVPEGAVRGLCTMYLYNATNNSNACPKTTDGVSGDSSIFCDPNAGFEAPIAGSAGGCDPDVCNDCQISFSTNFDNRTYTTTAQISPNGDSSNFEIESKGIFNEAMRQIKIFNAEVQTEGGSLKIENDCAEPKSTPQGTKVYICANVSTTISGDTIGAVTADIYYYSGEDKIIVASDQDLTLGLTPESTNDPDYPCSLNQYGMILPTDDKSSRAYYVDLSAVDTLETPNLVVAPAIPPCGIQ